MPRGGSEQKEIWGTRDSEGCDFQRGEHHSVEQAGLLAVSEALGGQHWFWAWPLI